jgi:PAS domain S-box-containing protein
MVGECMNAAAEELIRNRIKDLWEQTDFNSTLFENLVGYAVIAADFDGNIIAYNEGARQIYGYAREDVCGKQTIDSFFPREFIEDGRFQEAIDTLIATGRFSYEGEKIRKSGDRFPAQILFTLTKDKAGKVVGLVEIVEDLTERKRAEMALYTRALQTAAVARLGEQALALTKVSAVLRRAVILVTETLGLEYGAIWELLPNGTKYRMRMGVGWKKRLARRVTGQDSPLGDVVRIQKQMVTSKLPDNGPPCEAEWLEQHGVVSSASVPIRSGEHTFGVLSVYTTRAHKFTEDDIHFLKTVAHVLMTAVERTQYEEERHRRAEEAGVAQRIQQKLFPAAAPRLPGFDIGGMSYPAEATGGDYFDYIPMSDGGIAFAIGDVSGHSFGPALLMASTRAYLRALAQTRSDIGEIMTLVNRVVTHDTQGENFITLLLAHLDPETRSLVYANAGHPTGYIFDASAQQKVLLKSTGFPLGVMSEEVFGAAPPIHLEAGDVVLLLTDGIVEAFSAEEEPFGRERLLEIVRANFDQSAGKLVDTIYRAVRQFSQGRPQADDITVIVIKVKKYEL